MVAFEFTFSESFLVEAFRRSRRTKRSTRYQNCFKVVLGVPLAFLVALCAWMHAYDSAALLTVFLMLLIVSSRLDVWLMRRRFRRSPYYNDQVRLELSDSGLSATGTTSSSMKSRAIVTAARRLNDGILLLQGPGVSNWCPFDAIVAGTIDEADDLVRGKVRDYKCL